MRRQDANNPHGELGVQLKDSQGNPAHMTLGANPQTLSEEGDTAHGIRVGSTGQASTLASGNDRKTVGNVNHPVHQTSLVKVDDDGEENEPEQIYNHDMTISDTGLNTLKNMEEVKSVYYEDSNGYCTYGVGHLMTPVGPCGHLKGQPVPEELIKESLRADIANAESIVKRNVTRVELSQAKFDALVCFAYNTAYSSTLLRHVNNGMSDESIVQELLTYTHDSAGEFEGGLLKRSQWEATAFGYTGPFYKNYLPPNPTWG